jgi:Ribonuclease G/E
MNSLELISASPAEHVMQLERCGVKVEGTRILLIDSHEQFDRLNTFAYELIPATAQIMQLYMGERLIFDLFTNDEDIAKTVGRQVDLKSGVYLIIYPAEAATAPEQHASLSI